MNDKNDLFDFFQQASDSMQADYVRISRRSKQDPGTAGDEGEENWAAILREWLPSDYHIVTKGQILFEDGTCSPQVDVIILKPEYPAGLIRKNVKKYFGHCVAAAFECKLTLRPTDLQKVFETCALIKRKITFPHKSPFRELHSPMLYGLLSHKLGRKAKKDTSFDVINKKICEYDLAKINHPREMPDFFCIAELGTWVALKTTFLGPRTIPCWEQVAHVYGGRECVSTSYILHQSNSFEQIQHFTPIGAFICSLTRKLSWRRPNLQDIARYYAQAKVGGSGEGINVRFWQPENVYSAEVLSIIQQRGLSNGVSGDEWACVFL